MKTKKSKQTKINYAELIWTSFNQTKNADIGQTGKIVNGKFIQDWQDCQMNSRLS